MGNQGSFLGWPPNGGGGGGGVADYPFALAYAKTRRWRITAATTIPAGAIVISAINRSMNDASVKIGTGPTGPIGPGLQYNFEAAQNTIDMKMELSKEILLTPASGEDMEIYVAYPASSGIDPNTI